MSSTSLESTDARPPAPERWLTAARLEAIAKRCAQSLIEPTHWIDRRKDTVTVLDDTAIRVQTSVDFGCHADEHAIADGSAENGHSAGDPIVCAPLFVLAKKPSGSMAFDLVDEEGRSLSLVGRENNARITGEILVAMARGIASDPDSRAFTAAAEDIRKIAAGPPRSSKLRARRLLNALAGSTLPAPWDELAAHKRFCWWLRTAAEASIVVVQFGARGRVRKCIKLSYQLSIVTTWRSWLLRLGWRPYGIIIDAPWIEAQSYHLEATAPPGLRIEHALLDDDEAPTGVKGGDFTRHVHLYRPDAANAGAGAGALQLRVSTDGFLAGAWLAALLVVAALFVFAMGARTIAPNPSTAPALLLLLPGLLASLVSRSGRHALTARLLSAARNALICCAGLAYAAALAVALAGGSTKGRAAIDHRVARLHAILWPLFGAATVLWIGIAVAAVCGKPSIRRVFENLRRLFNSDEWRIWQTSLRKRDFELDDVLWLTTADALKAMYGSSKTAPLRARSGDKRVHAPASQIAVVRRAWYGTWAFLVSAGETELGTSVSIGAELRTAGALALLRRQRMRALERDVRKRLRDLALASAPVN